MSVGEYALGVAWLVAFTAILLFAAGRARRRICPSWSGPPAWILDVVLAVSMLVLVSEIVGLFGWFTRAGVLLGVVAIGGVAARTSSTAAPWTPLSHAPPAPRWTLWLAVVVSLATAAIWAEPVLQSFQVGMYRQDSTWYHLAFSANFFQTAHTGGLLFTDPLRLAAWFYPQNSELLHAVGMVAFGTDFLSPLINIGWMALALLAGWCVGRPFGHGLLTLLAVSVLLGSNVMQVQSGNAPSDIPALFFLLATIAILVNATVARSRLAPSARADSLAGGVGLGPLFVAALAAGLAIGTKVTFLVTIGALTLAVPLLTRRGTRRRSLGVWLGGVFLTGGFWYVRNLVHAGNPFPWVGLGILPTPSQLPIYPRPPHSIAGYLGSPGVWADWFAPGLDRMLGPLWPILLLGVAAGLLLALRRREDLLVRVLGAVGIVTVLAYVLNPIGAPGSADSPYGFASNLRYLAPALLVGLLTLTLMAARRGAAARWLAGALAIAFVSVAASSDSWGLGEVPGALILATALVAIPFGLAHAAHTGVSRRTLVLAAGTAALLVALLGYPQQRTYARQRYLAKLAPPSENPGFRSASEWEPVQAWARQQHDERIGLVGPSAAFGQYIFYGNDLSNIVRYVGEPGPHGAYRPINNCLEWRGAVSAGHYDYLVITPPLSVSPPEEPEEVQWTRGDSNVEEVLRTGPASVFRIRGPLDPQGCLALGSQGSPLPWNGLGVPGGGIGSPSGAFPPPGELSR